MRKTRTPASTIVATDRRLLHFIRGIASVIMSFLVVPSVAGPAYLGSFGPSMQKETFQTDALLHRLESLRNLNLGATLSFTRLNQSFALHHTPMALRLSGCTYDVDKDMPGLIDILLRAEVRVGFPAGVEKHQPEARFGVYFGVDSPDGVDLWFSNPLIFPPHDQWVVGQSHDRGEATAYWIMAAPTLRAALWNWARANGYPRPNTAAECEDMLKDDPTRSSSKQLMTTPHKE